MMIFIGQTLTANSQLKLPLTSRRRRRIRNKIHPPNLYQLRFHSSSINEYSNVYTFMILCNVPVAWKSRTSVLSSKNGRNFAQASRRVSVFGGHVHQRGSRHVRPNNAPPFDRLSLFEMVHTLILRFANMEKIINSLNLSTPIFRTLQYIYTYLYIYIYVYVCVRVCAGEYKCMCGRIFLSGGFSS